MTESDPVLGWWKKKCVWLIVVFDLIVAALWFTEGPWIAILIMLSSIYGILISHFAVKEGL